ncbi:MAG: hypothetical protein EA379_08060 [Phycisphaerales bacterium]|nr:MAG: hypothetical protein EA379_08060 [Phycisphaerales bacterium]
MEESIRLRPFAPLPEVPLSVGLPFSVDPFEGEFPMGGLAARALPNGDVQVFYAFGGVSLSGGTSSWAYNQVYSLIIPADTTIDDIPIFDPSWDFVGRYASGELDTGSGFPNVFNSITTFGNDLYALTQDFNIDSQFFSPTPSRFVRLTDTMVGDSGGVYFDIDDAMNLGLRRMGGLDGSNQQGRISLGAQHDRLLPPDRSGGGFSLFDDLAVVQADPRNRYVSNTFWGATTEIIPTVDTAFSPTLDEGSLIFGAQRIIGLVNGTSSTEFVFAVEIDIDALGVGKFVTEQTVLFLTIDFGASNSAGDPVLRKVELGGPSVLAAGGLNIGFLGSPVTLFDPNDGKVELQAIDELFARTAYSQQALQSGLIRDLVLQEILNSDAVSDPDLKAFDSTYVARLDEALLDNVDFVDGVGRAVFQFFTNLVPGDPFGITPGPDPAQFLTLEDIGSLSVNTIITVDIDGADREVFDFPLNEPAMQLSSTDAESMAIGPALTPRGNRGKRGVSQPSTQYYLEGGETGLFGRQINALYMLDPDSEIGVSGGTWFQVAEFLGLPDEIRQGGTDRGEFDFGPVLSGLGFVGEKMYSTLYEYFEPFAPDPRGKIIDFNYHPSSIVRLDPKDGTMHTLAVVPDVRFETLTGANDRGSLFAFGVHQGEGGDRTRIDSSFAFIDLTMIEIDPRNSYIKNTWWGANGDFTPNAGTFTPDGFDVENNTVVTRVWDAGYTNGGIVVQILGSAENGRGGPLPNDNLLVNINPNATGFINNPRIVMINELQPATFRGYGGYVLPGIAGDREGTGATPQPFKLNDPRDGMVDIYSINAVFATLAYSPEALTSGLIQTVFTDEFVRGADKPAQCATAKILQNVPAALFTNANTVNGVGRASLQLRTEAANSSDPDDLSCASSLIPMWMVNGEPEGRNRKKNKRNR